MGDSPRNVLDNSYQSMRSHNGMSQSRIHQDQTVPNAVPGNQQNTQQMFDMFANMMKMMMQQNGQSPTNMPNPSQLQTMMNQQKLPGVPSNSNLMGAPPQINSIPTGNVLDSSFRNFEDRFNHQQTDLLDFYEKMGKQSQSLSPIPGNSNQAGFARQNPRDGQNTKISQRDQLSRQQQQQPNSFELSATSEQLPFKSDFVDYDFQNQSQNISAIANNTTSYSQKPSRNPRDKDLEEAINSRNFGNNQSYGRYDYKLDERNNYEFNQRNGYQDKYLRNDQQQQQQQELMSSQSPSASKQRNNDLNYQRNNGQKGVPPRMEDQSQRNLDYNQGQEFSQKHQADQNYPSIDKEFLQRNPVNAVLDEKNNSKRSSQFQQPYDQEPERDYRKFAERGGNDYYDFKPKNRSEEDFGIADQYGNRNRDQQGYDNEFLRDSMQFNNNNNNSSINKQAEQQYYQNSKNAQIGKQQSGISKSNMPTTVNDRLFNDEDRSEIENAKPFNQQQQSYNQKTPLIDEDRPIKSARNNYTSNLQSKNSKKDFTDGDSVVISSKPNKAAAYSSGLPEEREELPEEHRINPFEEIPIKTNGGSKRFEDLIEEQLRQEEGQHNDEGEDWHDAGEKRPKNFLKKGTRSFLSNAQQRSKAASSHIETINTQQTGDNFESGAVHVAKPAAKKGTLSSAKGKTLPPTVAAATSSMPARNTLSSNAMTTSSVQLANKPSKQSLNYNQSQGGLENPNTSHHNQNSAPELDLGDTPTDAGNAQKAKKKFLQRGKGKGGGIQGATSSSNIPSKKDEEKQTKETAEKPASTSLARPKTSSKVETYDLISVDSGSKNHSEDEGYAKSNKAYQPNRYVKQEEQEGERTKGVLQFDDEEEWGDTAAQKKKEIKKRTQSGQQQQIRSGEVHEAEKQDGLDEANDAYDYDENNDEEQYSKVVQKYFNKKPSQKQAQSNSVGDSEKQFDPTKPSIEEYTNEQIEKLNAEISKFKLENERVRKMRAKYEDLLKSFTKEKEQFAKQKELEVQELEEWKKEEQKKIRNEKRIAERQQKATASMPNRKEREEIEGYKATIKKLQDEIKMKDSRNKLAMERTKKQLDEQVARNQELLDEIREMEKARVDLSKNGQKGQSSQISKQQQSVKSATSRDERSISSLSKKNQKQQHSAADFQFDNNTAWKREKNSEYQAHSDNWTRNGDQEEDDEEETYEKYQGEEEEHDQSQDEEGDDYRGQTKGQKGKLTQKRSSSQPKVDFDEEEEEEMELRNGRGNHEEHDEEEGEEDDEEIEKYEDIINFNPTNYGNSNNNMNTHSQASSNSRAKTEQSKHTTIINNAGPNSQRHLPNSKNHTAITNNNANSNNILNKSSSASKNTNNQNSKVALQNTNQIATSTNSTLLSSKSNNPPLALKKTNQPGQLDKKGPSAKWKYDITDLSKQGNIGIAMINRDIDINQFNYNGNPLYKEYTSIYSKTGKIVQQNNTQDGKIQREFENGTIEVVFPNKVRRQILKNGLTIIEFVNSDVKQVLPDQTIIYYFADADTTQITLPSAINIYKFPNDQIEIHFPSGKKEIKFTDGTARYVFEDGIEKTYFADGSVQTVDINRVKTITHANGEQEIIEPIDES